MVVFEAVYEVIFGLECHVASDWHTQISPLIASHMPAQIYLFKHPLGLGES